MKKLSLLIMVMFLAVFTGCGNAQSKITHKTNAPKESMQYNNLTPEEERVIVKKGTEMPFTGKYNDNKAEGFYTCKRCDSKLYSSKDKFNSNCGWPSFDDELPGAVKRVTDADGRRVEIVCANCGGHLGHVFEGEGLTDKNTRHCVNSISMNFIPASVENVDKSTEIKTERAIFASGCFWGTEYHFEKLKGVISTDVGFIGGHIKNPSYKEVCTGRTGHAEAVEVIYDPMQVTYEELVKLFFETHDQSQINRQGPDIGTQYRSGIFYLNEDQRMIATKVIGILKDKGYKVATEVTEATEFYNAEDKHQNYYSNGGGTPYCHAYEKKF